MKRLKVKTINSQFALRGLKDSGKSNMELFDEQVNEFLATMNPEKIYQITYLNSSASVGDRLNPQSIMIATITYFEDIA